MSDEQWRPVVGFEGLYEVSNHGRVRSLVRFRGERVSPRISYLRGSQNAGGYIVHSLRRHGHKHGTHRLAHRMVLESWVGPRPEGMEAAHLNGVPNDNRVENLAWMTHVENVSHQREHGTLLLGEKNPQAKLNARIVAAIRSLREHGVTLRDIARAFKIRETTVSLISRREGWDHVA